MAFGNKRRQSAQRDFDNTNRGALWDNERKENAKQPDYTGQINVDGRDYWISGWDNEDSGGKNPVVKLSVQPKEESRRDSYQKAQPRRQAPQRRLDYEDEPPLAEPGDYGAEWKD
jgi:hypothetical protein